MTETGWQAIGRIARLRRERLGLKQEELAQYGGPGVSTVGKFERAAQERFPLRTQHQMENALGWERTIIEQVVNSIDEGELTVDVWEHDLIEEDIPDLSSPKSSALDPDFAARLEALSRILLLVPPDDQDEALRNAVTAMLPLISAAGVTQLGKELRRDHTVPDFALAGSDATVAVMDVRAHPKAARTALSRGRALRRQQDEEAEASQEYEVTPSRVIDPLGTTGQPRRAADQRPTDDTTD